MVSFGFLDLRMRIIFFAMCLNLKGGEIVVVGSVLGKFEKTRGLEKCQGETKRVRKHWPQG